MGKKSNKQKIKEQTDSFLTVEKLIEHLKTLPKDAVVGTKGHYGEFHSFDVSNFFHYEDAETYIRIGITGNLTNPDTISRTFFKSNKSILAKILIRSSKS